MPFTYTQPAQVFDETSIRLGTAMYFQGGTVQDATYTEGNGIVVAVEPLYIDLNLYNTHLQEFQQVTVTIEDFVNGVAVLKVLTVEDGVGQEPTGAIPTDVYPPGEVGDLTEEHTDNTITFSFIMPFDEDLSHVVIEQDGVVVADNIAPTVDIGEYETYTVTSLQSGTEYEFIIKTVDESGNTSLGIPFPVQTTDITPPGEVTELYADFTDDAADIHWTNPTDEDLAYVMVEKDGLMFGDSIIDDVFYFNGLATGTEVTILVRAVDSAGNASDGTSITFTTNEAGNKTVNTTRSS